MSKLMDRMIKSTKIKGADILTDSRLFSEKEVIQTDVPAINIALSGDVDGGLRPGLTSIAGNSRHFKCLGFSTALEVYLDGTKITTTYGEFFSTLSDYPARKYFVKTHKGELTKIIGVVKKPAEMLKVTFNNGYELICAKDHAFLNSEENIVLAKQLEINSNILTIHGQLTASSIEVSDETESFDISIESPHLYINEETNGVIHHNTSYALLMAAAYLNKHEDAVLLYYDSEFGAGEGATTAFGIDPNRVLHVPIHNVEELKFDIMKKLDNNNEEGIKRGDKIFILVDSIGNLASIREANNAVDENSAQDMTRAKELKSLWRLVTPHLLTKNIPMVVIQHVYEEMKMFGKTIMSGGSGGMLSSDNVWIIGKSQEKDGTELLGYKFTINIEKSRYVKEKSKIPILVTFEGGISKYTGILDMALESGDVVKPKNARYQLVDPETGELLGEPVKEPLTQTEEFLGVVLKRESFKKWVRERYKIMQTKLIKDDTEDIEDTEE